MIHFLLSCPRFCPVKPVKTSLRTSKVAARKCCSHTFHSCDEQFCLAYSRVLPCDLNFSYYSWRSCLYHSSFQLNSIHLMDEQQWYKMLRTFNVIICLSVSSPILSQQSLCSTTFASKIAYWWDTLRIKSEGRHVQISDKVFLKEGRPRKSRYLNDWVIEKDFQSWT